MKTAISVENKVPKDHVKETANALVKVMQAGRKHNMDQTTIQDAIELLAKASSINGVSINGCTVHGGK